MKKVWQETIMVAEYTHACVVTNEYDGNLVVRREDLELSVKATAWYCKASGTYRLDAMAVTRRKPGSDTKEWHEGEGVRPLLHFESTFAPKAIIVRDAINRIDIYVCAVKMAFERGNFDMWDASDEELLEAVAEAERYLSF